MHSISSGVKRYNVFAPVPSIIYTCQGNRALPLFHSTVQLNKAVGLTGSGRAIQSPDLYTIAKEVDGQLNHQPARNEEVPFDPGFEIIKLL
jgi:hypothetical protein